MRSGYEVRVIISFLLRFLSVIPLLLKFSILLAMTSLFICFVFLILISGIVFIFSLIFKSVCKKIFFCNFSNSFFSESV